jgi:hypothetical protein
VIKEIENLLDGFVNLNKIKINKVNNDNVWIELNKMKKSSEFKLKLLCNYDLKYIFINFFVQK